MTDDLELRAQTRIGRVLNDKWRLDSLLGIGGMAAVYSARHRNGAKAALKLLHPELAVDPTVRQRFLAEGYAANKVEHPNAVKVLDDDVLASGSAGDEGTAYLVMELLEGESLLAYGRRLGRTLREDEVLEIADGVLDVLAAAHAHGIVHRDLKPENLFLVKPSSTSSPPPSLLAAALKDWTHVKVLDFGIARIADGGGKTRVGTTLGTPSYMAPEQAQGRRDAIDGRTDLFALGATMWRLLLGQRIHDAPSAAEILAKMATQPAPPVRSVAPQLSERMSAILDRAVAFHREQRYPDAATMRRDVRAALANEPLPYIAADAPGGEPTVPDAHAPRAPTFEAGGAEATTTPLLAPFPSSPGAVTLPNLAAVTPHFEPTPAHIAPAEIPRTDARIAPAPLPPTRAYPPVADPSRRPKLLLWVGLALVPIAALVLFLALRGGEGDGKAAAEEGSSANAKPRPPTDEPTPTSAAATDPASDEPAPAGKPTGSHGDKGHGGVAPSAKPAPPPTKKKPTAPKPPGAGAGAVPVAPPKTIALPPSPPPPPAPQPAATEQGPQ